MKVTSPGRKEGNAKEEGRRKHQHMKPSPKRATLERQGKRKSEADGIRNKTSGGGGGQKRLNQPHMAKTYKNLSTQRAKPTWREENARTHEKGRKGTHGELVNNMMHPQLMQYS